MRGFRLLSAVGVVLVRAMESGLIRRLAPRLGIAEQEVLR